MRRRPGRPTSPATTRARWPSCCANAPTSLAQGKAAALAATSRGAPAGARPPRGAPGAADRAQGRGRSRWRTCVTTGKTRHGQGTAGVPRARAGAAVQHRATHHGAQDGPRLEGHVRPAAPASCCRGRSPRSDAMPDPARRAARRARARGRRAARRAASARTAGSGATSRAASCPRSVLVIATHDQRAGGAVRRADLAGA